MNCRWVVCESGSHWLHGLFRFAATSLPTASASISILATENATEAESWCLNSGNAAVIWPHRHDDNSLLTTIIRLRQTPVMQFVALPAAWPLRCSEAREAALLYGELGAVAVLQTYSQLPAVCRLAQRYWLKRPLEVMSHELVVDCHHLSIHLARRVDEPDALRRL